VLLEIAWQMRNAESYCDTKSARKSHCKKRRILYGTAEVAEKARSGVCGGMAYHILHIVFCE